MLVSEYEMNIYYILELNRKEISLSLQISLVLYIFLTILALLTLNINWEYHLFHLAIDLQNMVLESKYIFNILKNYWRS